MNAPGKTRLAGSACRMLLIAAWAFAVCTGSLKAADFYRFADHLDGAAIKASQKPTAAGLAEPLKWDFEEQVVTWKSLRGRMGFRQGELILEGQGATPVIQSPSEPAIDWTRYDSLLIRMSVAGGSEVKILLGTEEQKQKLAPPGQYRVYRFKLDVDLPAFNRPLAIMPTDSTSARVSIDSIELEPRRVFFREPVGIGWVGKGEEYRTVIYSHSPSSLAYDVDVPPAGRLHFGIGVAEPGKSVRFRIRAGAGGRELYAKTISDPDRWEDAAIDLAPYQGRGLNLVFETEAPEGVVGLWANPVVVTSRPKQRPNVVVYMIDTLRAGHTSLLGYSRDTTPFLKKIGAQGVVFEDCHVQSTWTKPSVASMMTSLHTVSHGIAGDMDTIPQRAATLAEQLRRGGYVTASIIANPWAAKATGLERGFDYVMEYPVVHRYRRDAADAGTDSAALNQAVFPWLEAHHDEPFFLYAHATDPHAPYRPPPEFESRFAKPEETAAFTRDYEKLLRLRMDGGGALFNRADSEAQGIDPDVYMRRAIERYDAEIAHNDRNIELLAAKLDDLGVLDNTLFVVVSDHGEEFLDHGWTVHGHSLYQELTHALFLLWSPKLLPAPRRIAEPVQLIDLMPTLLELLDLPVEGVIQGQSLAPLVRGQRFRRTAPVMSSRVPSTSAGPAKPAPESRIETYARIDGNWKLIYRDRARSAGLKEVELYDRKADRAERNDVAAEHPEVVARLMKEVREWIEAQKQVRQLVGPAGQTTLDRQTIDRLKSLGYIGGTTSQ